MHDEEGHLTDTGALMCDTGKFTGRSPQDRFIVEDEVTKDKVWWGNINKPISPENFDRIHNKMIGYLEEKRVYVRDAYAGADKTHRLKLRVINTMAWHNLFCYNMFIEVPNYKLQDFVPNFTVICCPEFEADPDTDGVRQENFAIINLKKRMILGRWDHLFRRNEKRNLHSIELPAPNRRQGVAPCTALPTWELKNMILPFILAYPVQVKPLFLQTLKDC